MDKSVPALPPGLTGKPRGVIRIDLEDENGRIRSAGKPGILARAFFPRGDGKMTLACVAVGIGLALLVWSADRFVAGSAALARHFRMPPLLIGMLVVGFGTSAPELVVSALAAVQGNPGIALGNAYGSNITNIALILGITALIGPIGVQSRVLRLELPVLTAATLLAAWQLRDGAVSRLDALALLGVFAGLVAWAVYQGLGAKVDPLGGQVAREVALHTMPIGRATCWLVVGLILLIVSSRILVWGAVKIAQGFGVSDLMVGLTIVAVGTSLPELASSVIAAHKKEHDIAVGNIIGSNLFNTLAVVGMAAAIRPLAVGPEVLLRDVSVMGALTVALFVFGYGFRGNGGRINRFEGAALLAAYAAYTALLVQEVINS